MSFFISSRFAAVAALSCSMQAGAADTRLNCDDLAKVIQGLDRVASGLEQTKVIEEDSELDKSLGKLVESLKVIAESEKNEALSTAVEAMDTAWDQSDHPGFQAALERVVGNVDRIIRRDCN